MLSYASNPSDPPKSIGKSTVQHNSSDGNITGDNPLPEVEQHQLIASSADVHNFSIREFVLAARSKDIGTNWPFPDKHLRLCLKHGVKDLLPPFQSKTLKRKQLSPICLEKTSSAENGILTKTPDEEPSHGLTVYTSDDVALTKKITVDHLDVNFDKSDKDSDLPSSVTSNSQAYPSSSGGTFKHHKVARSFAKNSTKKCKLIVKFGSPSVPSSNEEIMPHKTYLSESPASKVCPVCKTFSSSSNTTLNAHIDQCLSLEATSEGMADSKTGAKCKVKARKMRSMVDIYETALVCTIEDLDRRNGSSWATDLSLPDQNDGLTSVQGNKKIITPATEPDKEYNADGGVYIDANGRKVRILSKMDSFSSVVAAKADHKSKMPQMSKRLSNSKEKHRGTSKYHKLAVSNKKLSAPKMYLPEVSRSRSPSNDTLLSKDKSQYQVRGPQETDEQETFRDRGTHRHYGQKLCNVKHTNVKSQTPRSGSFGVEKSSSHVVSTSATCLSENVKKMKSSDDIRITTNRCLGVKRTGLSMSKDDRNFSTDANGHKRPKKTIECITESTYVGKNFTWKPLKQVTRPGKEIEENLRSPVKIADGTMNAHRFLQKSARLPRNNTSSLGQLSVHGTEIWKKTICSTNKEDHVQIEDEDEDEDTDNDEDVATWQCDSQQLVTDESRLNESWQDRGATRRVRKEVALNVSVNTSDDFADNLGVEHGLSDIQTDPCMNLTAERTMGSFIRSMNAGIQKRADSHDYQSTSPEPSKDSSTGPPKSGPRPADPVLDNGDCTLAIMESESNAAPGNTFSDIDPIPIPGPPGSFLPSPGHAETEDYQGNSSLTASLISSHEQEDIISLDSPNSAASSVSNLAAEMSEKVAEKSASTGNHAIATSSLLGFPIPSSEVSMEKVPVIPRAMKVGAPCSKFGVQQSFVKPQESIPPCCCSRRERVSRGSVVDYQESQLLRRRTMSAVILPPQENISCSLNTAPSYSCAGSDIYSLSSSSSFRAEAIPLLETPAGFASPKYPDTVNANKFHSNGDSESASPSAVLRLMGKNLMVAKNDEDLSGPVGDAANTRMLSRKTASPSKAPNSSYFSQYQKAPPPDPSMVSPSYSDMRHNFDFRIPSGTWGQINFPRPELTNHSQAVLTGLHGMRGNRGVPAPLDLKWPIQPKSGFDMVTDQMNNGAPAAIDFRRRVTIVDDDAASEISALKNGATFSHGLKGTGVSMAAEHAQSRLAYPGLSSAPVYMQQGPRNTCFPLPFSDRSSVNPPQVNISQNGPYVLQGGPYMTSSQSVHPKSGLFYSPGLP
uniref:Hapless 8 n=1 Tax=Kalanchoe fedtschenkoi TaxID=63787 RepID=A0A7N0ZXY7_KALFE